MSTNPEPTLIQAIQDIPSVVQPKLEADSGDDLTPPPVIEGIVIEEAIEEYVDELKAQKGKRKRVTKKAEVEKEGGEEEKKKVTPKRKASLKKVKQELEPDEEQEEVEEEVPKVTPKRGRGKKPAPIEEDSPSANEFSSELSEPEEKEKTPKKGRHR